MWPTYFRPNCILSDSLEALYTNQGPSSEHDFLGFLLQWPLTLHGRVLPPWHGMAQHDCSNVPRGMVDTGPLYSGQEQKSKTQADMELGTLSPEGKRSQGGKCHSQKVPLPVPGEPERRMNF